MREAIQIPGTALSIEPRRKGPPGRVVGSKVVLAGEIPWLLRGPANALNSAEKALSGFVERLDDRLLAIRFRNAVGRFRLGDATLEVVSGKWTAAHFDGMLADLIAKAAALPFGDGFSGASPYERRVAAPDDVLYHAFVYLRHATLGSAATAKGLDPLPQALSAILVDPSRRWERERRRVATDRATCVDAASLVEAVSGRERLTRVPPAVAARVPLAGALGGRLPRTLQESRLRVNLDTPENRFVKAFLEFSSHITGRLRAALRPASAFTDRLVAESRDVDRALEPFRRAPLWHDVGRMVHFPAASTTLQRRRGYRQVFGHFARLKLTTRLPLDRSQIDDLLELKDIALLYELWTFFTVADELSRRLGPPREATPPEFGDLTVTVPQDRTSLKWPGGTILRYNPRFLSGGRAGRRSYSVPLRPDLGLWLGAGPNRGLHLLDAKFRLRRLGDWAEDEDAGIAAAERRGDFKRADLYKMHAYRDAIPEARSVWILYPGTEVRFFGCGCDRYEGSASLPEIYNGVGAVPLRPGDDQQSGLRRVLGILLGRE